MSNVEDPIIYITHPDLPGLEVGTCTMSALASTWGPRGWIEVPPGMTPEVTFHLDNTLLGATNGIAELGPDSKLKSSQLPAALSDPGRFHVSTYGAVANGVTNDGPAIQAAINAASAAGGGTVVFGPGIHQIATSLVLKTNVNLVGVGGRGNGGGTRLRTSTVDIFTITADTRGFVISGLWCESLTGGGHIFNFGSTSGVSRFTVTDCVFHQKNNAKSVVVCGREMLECRWAHFDVVHTQTATVPSISLSSSIGGINVNTFDNIRFQYSGDYSIHIESTAASSYMQDNVMRNLNFEQCHGGEIRLLGCRDTILENCAGYDATSYNKSRVYIGKSTLGLMSSNISLWNVTRRGAISMGSVFDIELEVSGASGVLISGCNGLIELAGTQYNTVFHTNFTAPVGTVSSIHSSTTIVAAGVVKAASFTTAGRPAASLYGAGSHVFDSTLGKPIWSNGTVWKDATGTTV